MLKLANMRKIMMALYMFRKLEIEDMCLKNQIKHLELKVPCLK